jgi:glycosyltransferase involved in cell wall biosynthesis
MDTSLRCVFLVTPVLPQDARHQLQALLEAGLLNHMVCSLSYVRGGRIDSGLRWLDRMLGTKFIATTERRRLDAVPTGVVSSHIWPELWEHVRRRLHLSHRCPVTTDRYLKRVDQAAARRLGSEVKLVLAREDCCLHTFRAARAQNVRCLYDIPTTYYQRVRAIMEREEAAFPGASLPGLTDDEYSSARNQRKDEELASADHVLVPSRFVGDSIMAAGVPQERITVIPFGCQPAEDITAANNSGPRRRVFLAVGNLCLRKGTHRLLRVWKRLGAHKTHTLRLVGSIELSATFLGDYSGIFEHVPRLPRPELARHYATSLAYIMPAAAEGMAVVITEALSYGLPVIASENSGATGFISHAQEGLLYPYDDEDRLCECLERFLSGKVDIGGMREAAYALAKRWTWRHYREGFVALVRSRLADTSRQSERGAFRYSSSS